VVEGINIGRGGSRLDETVGTSQQHLDAQMLITKYGVPVIRMRLSLALFEMLFDAGKKCVYSTHNALIIASAVFETNAKARAIECEHDARCPLATRGSLGQRGVSVPVGQR
jgi:hypothetical protein